MSLQKKHTGIAIALAWPQTYCKQPGSWYDPVTLFLGINRNHYYKVGHAALVLVNPEENKAQYFDFGRYHAPYKHGRVRSAETDHDLEIRTVPVLSKDKKRIENFRDILSELQQNKACHGEGELYAAYCPVNFDMAYAKAQQMQAESPIPYGPFVFKGSNCSRFVNTVIRAGKPDFRYWFGLNFKVPFTPTPISNVKKLENRQMLPRLLEGELFCPLKKLNRQLLVSTLPAPEKHPAIPENARWLSGEGAGSWFDFEFEGNRLKATRYSPEGVIECTGLFENRDAIQLLGKHSTFSVSYPSNCKTVSLKVSGTELRFYRAG